MGGGDAWASSALRGSTLTHASRWAGITSAALPPGDQITAHGMSGNGWLRTGWDEVTSGLNTPADFSFSQNPSDPVISRPSLSAPRMVVFVRYLPRGHSSD